jgi:hypothetical protein
MLRSLVSTARGTPGKSAAVRFGALVILIAVGLLSSPGVTSSDDTPTAGKWGGAIDPDALQVLKKMTDYLGSLQRFSMHTENTYEDVLATDQKIQFGFSSEVVIQRPDRLRAERTDGFADQYFIYDGESLVVHDGHHDLFARVAGPDNLDDLLHFARENLDLIPPAGDMVFTNAFELLTSGITSGFVVGTSFVGDVKCTQLAFTTPVVDWQVWIAEGDAPLPYKYVLTTRDDPAHPQFVTRITAWNTDPDIGADTFTFDPSPTAMEIDFLFVDPGTASVQ